MLDCTRLIVTSTRVVCRLWQHWELALRANLQFPCQLKQAAPLKDCLWT
jgi:hypothetical protein